MEVDKVVIYTDGACLNNPGKGGHGYVFTYNDGEYLHSGNGGEKDTTNNRMELMAVISALEMLDGEKDITIITDSKYVMQGITEWIKGWKAKGWIGSNKKPVKNQDLWKRLDSLVEKAPPLKWQWVKGHSGNKWNEFADKLATEAAALA
jgi:ribonuclease HI